MVDRNYWTQKATPWVSITVLAGGLAIALILFFIVKVENNSQFLAGPSDFEFQELGN